MNRHAPQTIRRSVARRLGHRSVVALLLTALVVTTAATVGTSQPPPSAEATEQPGFPGAALAAAEQSPAEPPGGAGAAGEIIGFSHSDASGTQTITLVHTGKSWMAVYHIDRSGQIRLASSRPIDADFTLQFNATSPLPEEIRGLGGRGK